MRFGAVLCKRTLGAVGLGTNNQAGAIGSLGRGYTTCHGGGGDGGSPAIFLPKTSGQVNGIPGAIVVVNQGLYGTKNSRTFYMRDIISVTLGLAVGRRRVFVRRRPPNEAVGGVGCGRLLGALDGFLLDEATRELIRRIGGDGAGTINVLSACGRHMYRLTGTALTRLDRRTGRVVATAVLPESAPASAGFGDNGRTLIYKTDTAVYWLAR